jgi:hypothetical protein
MIRGILAWIGLFAILIFGMPIVGMAVHSTIAVGSMVVKEMTPLVTKGVVTVQKAINK